MASSLAHIVIPGATTTDFLSAVDCAKYCTPTIRFLLMPTILMSARCSLVVLNHHRLRLNVLSCTLFPFPSSPFLMILFLVNYCNRFLYNKLPCAPPLPPTLFFLFFLVISASRQVSFISLYILTTFLASIHTTLSLIPTALVRFVPPLHSYKTRIIISLYILA